MCHFVTQLTRLLRDSFGGRETDEVEPIPDALPNLEQGSVEKTRRINRGCPREFDLSEEQGSSDKERE
ncbi:hypothetical protein GmHk_06G017395 [Glycine max]|nr:hypothetical protein GmHk_06G017395 [Glycine max]